MWTKSLECGIPKSAYSGRKILCYGTIWNLQRRLELERLLGGKKQGIMRYQAPKIGQSRPLFLRACPVIGPSFTPLSSLVQG